jgi:large subunit ribosomal protein L21
MYAVIKSGGKQYRVEEGEQLAVELLGAAGEVELSPVLVVDGDRVLSTPTELEAARVSARVVDEARGPKVTGFTYKPKTNNRKRWGHRQRYSLIEITGITAGGAPRKAPAEKKAPAAKKATTAKKAPATKKSATKKSATKRPPKKA